MFAAVDASLQRLGIIVGASKPWQIEQAVQALDVTLGPQELAALAAPYQPHQVLGHQ